VGIEEQIKSALRPVKGIEQAIIYGSYAKGAMDAESDIDVLLIGEHRPREAVKHINPISKQSGRKINLVNMTPEEYEVKRKEPFLTQVLNEKHIRLL
jgi:predicted nucleotidyltransferase